MFGHVVKDMVRDSAETEAALEQANAQQGDRPNPLHTAFVAHGKTTLLVAGVASFWPTVFYVSFVWIATFETTLVEPPLSSAFTEARARRQSATTPTPPNGQTVCPSGE